MTTRKHPTKVMNEEQKEAILSTYVEALTSIDENAVLNVDYLSTNELSKLKTISEKLSSFIEVLDTRLTTDLQKVTVSVEVKEKRKLINQKITRLSPEELDNLLSKL